MTSEYIIDEYLIKLYFNEDFINIECIDNKMNQFSNKLNGIDIKLPFNLKNIYKIICDKLEKQNVNININNDNLKIEFFSDNEYEFNFDIILYEDNKSKLKQNELISQNKLIFQILEKQNKLIIKLQEKQNKLILQIKEKNQDESKLFEVKKLSNGFAGYKKLSFKN